MKNNKILIVDDEVDFGIVMSSFFTKKGYNVYTAMSITDGLKILEEQRPEYIFFDNNLPDGLGWSNAQFVLNTYPETRLVLMSALQTPTTSAQNFSILYKPYIVDDLQKMFP